MLMISITMLLLGLIALLFSKDLLSYLMSFGFLSIGTTVLLIEKTNTSQLKLLVFVILFALIGNLISMFFETQKRKIVNIEEEQ